MQKLIESVGALDPKQRKALAVLLKQKGINLFGIAPVFKRSEQEPLLLSYAQQRQWFLWQLEPDSPAYNIPLAIRLQGALDVKALQRSLDVLVARHESLRTVFVEEPEGVRQQILPPGNLALSVQRLAPGVGRETGIESFLTEQTGAGFDLAHGPLLRAALLQVDNDEHVLSLVQHHIVSDAWSLQVMVRELMHGYGAFRQGEQPQLPALPVQYADYALWQRQWMDNGERERQLAYWSEQLQGPLEVLALPTDRPRPAERSLAGASLDASPDAHLAAQLKALAARQGVTVFVLMLAAFQTLLHRLAGQEAIRVGVPNANRGRPETEGLIGFFVNTQVMQAQVRGELRFSDLLEQVKAAALQAQAYQDLPFEQLLEVLHTERSLSHSALFQVMFNHQREEAGQASAPALGLTLEPLVQAVSTSKFDLTLNTLEHPGGIDATLIYACDLFDAATVERIAGQWRRVLQAIVDDAQVRIEALPLLAGEDQQQLAQWGQGPTQAFACDNVLALFEQQVAAHPERLAAVCNARELSYAELDRLAGQRAAQLRALGVRPESRVALVLERSSELLVAILAVFKAGACYLPLDPQAGSERLRSLILDSAAQVVLTTCEQAASLPAMVGPALICLDQPLAAEAPVHSQQPLAPSCAYVIYTSGSTGQPKGVMVSHGALANYVQGLQQRLPLDDVQSMAMISTVAADLGHTVLFGALCGGQTLHLLDRHVAMDAQALAATMTAHQVDVLKIVPSHLAALLASTQGAQLLPRRLLVLGGEACPPALLEHVRQLAPQCRVFNHYGPTESTVGVLAGELAETGIALGQPLANSRLRVLDSSLQAVANGGRGELYIGGAGLARGYLGQPGLTAERFVPDPSGQGARLYRSGDGVQLQDGHFRYQGRIDDQLKIRGFRVEPGEVAACLRSLAGVQQAVVVGQAGERGQQLLGYVVSSAGTGSQVATTLLAALRERLPEYMVPAHLMLLEQLPLTANGKLDRKALPNPGQQAASTAYQAPQGELEQRLACVWQDVLKVSQVGRHDNFFELGGDSIISIQVVSRAREAGIHFTPKQLFQHQSVQELATVARLGEMRAVIDQGPVRGAALLLPIQQMFFDTEVPERHHWNQSVLLAPRSPLSATALEAALQALWAHHDALRLRFTQGAQGWQAEHHEATPATPLLWQRDTTLTGLSALCEQAQCSFDLSQGPLLRAVLFNLADGEQRLLLVVHHLVVDGVSWRILLEDLQSAYTRLSNGQTPMLPAKTCSAKHWAEQLQRLALSAPLQAELAYWQAQSMAPDLPARDPQCQPLQRDARTVYTRLDAATTQRLLQHAPAAYRTRINELLLAALTQVIGRWTGLDTTQVVLEGHGRDAPFADADLTRSVGWFTSKYPLELHNRAAVADAIKTVKEQLRAVPGNGMGYGVLRYLGATPARQALGARTLPRITFNYLGQFDNSFDPQAPTALFSIARENGGSERGDSAPLGNWLTLNGQVYEGRLSMGWVFSPQMFDEAVIQGLADDYAHTLRTLVEHCCDEQSGGLTPADFPLARLQQAQLDSVPLAPREVADIYPLSPMQQGMLFHSLEADEAALYINQTSVAVEGLEIERFIAAWDQAVANHDVLRSGFWNASHLSQPLQVVSKRAPSVVRVLDWRGQAVAANAIETLVAADCREGFDLLQPPLMRVTLVRLDEQRCHLIWTRHHILMDGWSSSRLLGEVFQAYHGQAVSVEGRYRDYIAWLQAQDDARTLEQFWIRQLQGLDEVTELAASTWPRPAAELSGHAAIYLEWDAQRTARLRSGARQLRVTPNTLVQAAWLLLLQRYTGQQRVCFGATVAGRPASLPQAGNMLGLFINTLPILQSPQPQQRVGQWLEQLQAYNLEVRDHEHASLADIQRWAGHSGRSLFDSIIVFENYPVDERLEEVGQGRLQFGAAQGRDVTNYPMDLAVNLGETLSIEFLYLRNRFDAASVVQIRAAFETLLDALLANPQATLGSLALLDAPARQRLADANPLHPVVHDAPSLLEQIQVQCTAQPEATAVLCGAQALSYGELEQCANQLAHYLRAQGVGPEVCVGVALNRSVEMIVALYAVHKTGAAYVPLDIDYPQDRLQWIVEDSAMTVLLTHGQVRARLPQATTAQVLDLDSLVLSDQPSTPLPIAIDADHLAYLIYTSGSTGKPKGVAVPRGPLTMHCQAIVGLYQMDCTTRELLFMSFAFDGAQERWLSTLLAGGCLVLRDDSLWTAEETWAVLHAQRISIACFPPAYLQQIAEYGQTQPSPPAVRIYCFGGDAVAEANFERVRRTLRPQWITNGYGPTETVVTPMLWKADADSRCEAAYAPIGQRVGNRSLYVLDAQLNPLPDGVAGELYIGGEGLARGYHQRPGLTAERFVASPFEAGGRLYRSGDLVRRRPDGVMDYLGRLDHQVKVRGFRIELGEIEARLRALGGVREALVVARDSAAGKRLIGYVVGNTPSVSAETLRSALQAQLPDYMVPAQILLLDAMPLNPSGKLDRLALPDPDFQAKAYVAPRNALEQMLAGVWQEVLELDQVGVTDNFFELGGDSLRTLKVLSKVRQQAVAGFELKLRDMLAKPTIAQLSGFAEQPGELDPLLALNGADGTGPVLFCLHAGFGTVFDYEPLARRLQGHCNVYGVQCRMLLDRQWDDDSLEAMAIDYAQYIRQKQAQGPYRLLGWSLGGTLAVLVAAELEKQGQAVSFLGLVDSFIPLSVEAAQTDEWRDDLPAFLAQTSSLTVTHAQLPADEPDLAQLSALLATLQSAGEPARASDFDADELARAFQVGLRLKALSRRAPLLPRTLCAVQRWWRSDLPGAAVQAFEANLTVAVPNARIDAGHYDILANTALLEQLQAHLLYREAVEG
ncbi:non-ribosomal peptide synthetase [Pseudomonas alkylphenolica]|uniref:Non-ribosomal peptide synthetase n=1 Tax=Pseudomonas alkylphenolica TaxID=237609 RepID=A0A443ZQQ7_9PSED|nr:non-ribosomal peptide synthetase [Pseudomonas alkylphenolica]RWU21430.1 non-ribosomal peptide synthetase [Pseudomonas alkylphenolica]